MLAPILSNSKESLNSVNDMTLYEWITSKDPTNRIENLPTDVSEIIEKVYIKKVLKQKSFYSVICLERIIFYNEI